LGITLKVLIVEDSEDDFLLLLRELRRGGYEPAFERVETPADMKSALNKQSWDIIISDYKMPNFSGLHALKLLKDARVDLPFILVSGTIGEELAVEAMKTGANDYVMKNDLSRLVPAIRRELREAKIREDRGMIIEALRESENLYRTIFETTGTTTLIIEEDTTVSLINMEGEKLTGFSKEEIEGRRSWTDFIAKDELDKLKEYHRLRRTDPNTAPKTYETRLVDKAGNIKDVLVTASMIPGTKKSAASLLDITERKHSEEEREKLHAQLQQAQKMEAVGQLAGGVAHDFNNMLTAIMGYCAILNMRLKEDDSLRRFTDQILAVSEKAANLTHSLLAFSRKQIINPKPVALNEIVNGVEKLLTKLIGEDIEFKTILSRHNLVVTADRGQIEQVLMNLIANAGDAMPDGGSLSISTEPFTIDGEFIDVHGYGKIGAYARISISDTGEGMDKETRERIFEPFFTTKEVGKGTGLGLSIVYGIVKQHEGYIDVYTAPKQGTTFNIYLPLTEDKIVIEKSGIPPSNIRGSETILLAEDDKDVRVLIKGFLEKYGYRVIEAVDGADAINKFMRLKESIQFLLFDVVMPKKNGKEAFEKIRMMKPGIKALFMSGHSDDIIYKKGILGERLTLIMKPVSPTNLIRKVREVLDKA
jgi:two-component system, cell cycle sensor histidine kinase and response regulator CckA